MLAYLLIALCSAAVGAVVTDGSPDEPRAPLPGQGIRVLGAGLSRTSTQSLALALTELGYKALHAEGFHPKMPVGRGTNLTPVVTEAASRYLEGAGFEALDPALRVLDSLGIDAVVDLPWSECAADLLKLHPRVKVIATVRDSAEIWYKSYWEHFRWASIFPPCLSHSFVIYWRHITTQTGCGFVTRWPPWYPTEEERAHCLRAHDRRIEQLRGIVPQGSLLVFNVKEGWGPLCQFLEVEVPNTSFPRHDAYSFLHWSAGPTTFLAAVYAGYALMSCCCGLCVRQCGRRYWPSRSLPKKDL